MPQLDTVHGTGPVCAQDITARDRHRHEPAAIRISDGTVPLLALHRTAPADLKSDAWHLHSTVVMNNRRSEPEPGGDIQGYEGDVPGKNTNRGMNRTTPQLSAGETCQTPTATGYGFTRDVHHLRPVSEPAQMLVRSAAAGANFLLNAEPTPEGMVAAPAIGRLTRIGLITTIRLDLA